MTKKNIILILGMFFSPFFLISQHSELGIKFGVSLYQGDLSPDIKELNPGQVNPMVGVFGKYNFNRFIVARAGFNYGLVSAEDAKSTNDGSKNRNLSFRSNILEGNLMLEINILGYEPYNLEKPWSPYVFAGIALFHYNPKAKYDGEWIELQPLGTEGQGLPSYPDRQPYSLNEFAIPFGAGLKFALSDTWNLGVEGGFRRAFTDYLDDVSMSYVEESLLLEKNPLSAALANRSGNPIAAGSTRGNDKVSDWYAFFGVTLSKNFLDNGLVGSRRRGRKSKTGCPTF
jgi:opacity protein-like surface antigen